jgi:hypothetical protein
MAKSTKSSGKVARATIAVRARVGLEVCARWLPDPATERQPPGTNWVVVTDKNGPPAAADGVGNFRKPLRRSFGL